MAIINYGGWWTSDSQAGIINRGIAFISRTFNIVASRRRHPKLIIYYSDDHDVDEELRTICSCGGHWDTNIRTGITFRYVYDYPTFSVSVVASYVCKHHLLTLDWYHNVGYKIPTDQSIHMYPYLYKFI